MNQQQNQWNQTNNPNVDGYQHQMVNSAYAANVVNGPHQHHMLNCVPNVYQRPIMYMSNYKPSAPQLQNLPELYGNPKKRKRQSQLTRLEAKVQKMEKEKKNAEEEKIKQLALDKMKKIEEERKELEAKVVKLEEQMKSFNEPEPTKWDFFYS